MAETTLGHDTSCSYTANWEIVDGSLSDSITFESSAAPMADHLHSLVSTPKSPLMLRRSSLHSPPCEITFTFARQHQVRQVYVRSTARVYEIYYGPKIQTDDEYLCTVRCGVAAQDDQMFQPTCTEETSLANLKVADKELDEKNRKTSCSSSTNEDDWVEVKTSDSTSLGDNGNNGRRSMQDFYEATAEISDANPCMSIKIRLLSLQNKDCVFLDEIYVFADMVESNDLENKAGKSGDTSASSYMAMLVPTLLQLLKARGLSQMQNEQILHIKETERTEETVPKTTEQKNHPSTIEKEESSSAKQCEIKLQNVGCTECNKKEFPPEVSDRVSEPAPSRDHVERLLDQLVSRVSRLEDVLLRFEDNMLKPISSMDARLQRVEQQVEELSKKSKNLDMATCKRYSAPEFCCHDSDHFPLFNIDDRCLKSDLFASHGKDFALPAPEEMVNMVNATQSFPSLVVNVPEFSYADDDEDDDVSTTVPLEIKPKLSIDDAVASALAGFMSLSLSEPHKYTQALVVKAPDFSSEEDGSTIGQIASMESEFEITSKSVSSADGTERLNDVKYSFSSFSSYSSAENLVEVSDTGNDIPDHSTGEAEEPIEQCQHNKEGERDLGRVANHMILPGRDDAAKINSTQMIDEGKLFQVLDEADVMNQALNNHADNSTETAPEAEAVVGKSELKPKVAKEVPSKDIVQAVLGLSRPLSAVDFGTPILDVIFDSGDKSHLKCPLEFLLGDRLTSDNDEDEGGVLDDGHVIGEHGDLVAVNVEEVGEQDDLISVNVEEVASGTKMLVDPEYCSLSSMPLKWEIEKQDDYEDEACRKVECEMQSSSLI